MNRDRVRNQASRRMSMSRPKWIAPAILIASIGLATPTHAITGAVRVTIAKAGLLVGAGNPGIQTILLLFALAMPPVLPTTIPFAGKGVGTAVRVAAARSALVLAHDTGEATARLTEGERRELRRAALRWLREWLNESPTGLELFLVKRDPAFRPVRDPAARDQLPPDERAEWRDLWEAVHSARGTGHQRYAFFGDPVEPPPPGPREVAPPPREVKP